MAKATKLPSGLWRSHAPVLPVTPAHTTEDASSKRTSTVLPCSNCDTGPTPRHVRAAFSNKGASRNPATGTPIIAAPAQPAPMLTRVMSLRRSGESSSLMEYVSNPAGDCEPADHESHQRQPHARYRPEQREVHAESERRRPIRRARKAFGKGLVQARTKRIGLHHTSIAGSGSSRYQRANMARIAVR